MHLHRLSEMTKAVGTSCGPTIERAGAEANVLGATLVKWEKGRDEAAHLSERRAAFGPVALPCPHMAQKQSRVWHGGMAG